MAHLKVIGHYCQKLSNKQSGKHESPICPVKIIEPVDQNVCYYVANFSAIENRAVIKNRFFCY